jgi:hypothetical protein
MAADGEDMTVEGLKYLEEAMDEFVAEIDLIGSVATRTGYMLEHGQVICWSNVIVKVILRGVCLI